MSIPLLPEFDADGYQLEPTTADINDLIAAANTAAGAAIATLPTFTADGYQVEPSIAKLNEIITALNDGGATLDLLPTFAADGYETMPTTVTFNGVITAVNEYEPPASDPVLESMAVLGGGSPGQVDLPSGIQEGDLLVALAYWGSDALEAIPGFTIIESAGTNYDWIVTQYRVADGTEVSPIVPDPDWVVYSTVVARISGVDAGGPINVGGTPEKTGGSSATSKSVELDSISPDAAGCALVTLVLGESGATPSGLTVEGVAIDLSDLQEIYAGGVNLELLESSGATGTRTAVLSGASDVNRITAALIALNPA